ATTRTTPAAVTGSCSARCPACSRPSWPFLRTASTYSGPTPSAGCACGTRPRAGSCGRWGRRTPRGPRGGALRPAAGGGAGRGGGMGSGRGQAGVTVLYETTPGARRGQLGKSEPAKGQGAVTVAFGGQTINLFPQTRSLPLALAFAPGGRYLAVAHYTPTVRV